MRTPRIPAGSLDRRVLLERRAIARNATGEGRSTWSALAQVWAERRDMRGRDLIAARAQDFEAETVWRLRWRGDVVPATTRLVADGQPFEILSVAEIGRREGIEIVTRRQR